MNDAQARDFRESAREEARRLGFSLVGFTTADPLEPVVQRRWERWFETDRAGKMNYLRRRRPRRTHPRDLLPEARSIVVVAAGYYDGEHGAPPSGEGPRGKIARYAWGRDYHFAIRERLNRLAEWIEREAPRRGWSEPVAARACSDSAPLDERSLAVRAGLGFIGKNTLLLHPENGSWMLLGALLVSVAFPGDEPLAGTCGACRRCIEACPTDAIAAPYELDARRCLSYLTIEQRDPIPAEFAERMEGWAFGCDICQEVCPFNERPLGRLLPELAAAQGVGPWLERGEVEATPSGKAFRRRWGATPLSRPGLKGMLNNFAALVKGRSRAAK